MIAGTGIDIVIVVSPIGEAHQTDVGVKRPHHHHIGERAEEEVEEEDLIVAIAGVVAAVAEVEIGCRTVDMMIAAITTAEAMAAIGIVGATVAGMEIIVANGIFGMATATNV